MPVTPSTRFVIQALTAKHGDGILLRYGTPEKLALIDGGPATVYRSVLATVLAAEGTQPPLIDWLLETHVDDDHIIVPKNLLAAIHKAHKKGAVPPANVATIFHNTPAERAVTPASVEFASKNGRSPADRINLLLARTPLAVATKSLSFPNGRDLANLAESLGVNRNPPNGHLLLAGMSLPSSVVKPLTVRVVCPTKARVNAELDAWEASLGEGGGVTPQSLDTSLTNLSSLVVHVSNGHVAALLTGDARADDIIDGLDAEDFPSPLRVNVFKVPHHGSVRSTAAAKPRTKDALFARVVADFYLICADGRHENPDFETLEMIINSRAVTESYTIVFTTSEGSGGETGALFDDRIAKLRTRLASTHRTNVKLFLPRPGELSVSIDLSHPTGPPGHGPVPAGNGAVGSVVATDGQTIPAVVPISSPTAPPGVSYEQIRPDCPIEPDIFRFFVTNGPATAAALIVPFEDNSMYYANVMAGRLRTKGEDWRSNHFGRKPCLRSGNISPNCRGTPRVHKLADGSARLPSTQTYATYSRTPSSLRTVRSDASHRWRF
jgi:hypothetical protein